MSVKTQKWGWKMTNRAFERRWPRWTSTLFNHIGNYGLRGTFREWLFQNGRKWRYRLTRKSGIDWFLTRRRARRGIPYKESELRYSQRARCRCGAGLAYWPGGFFLRSRDVYESHGWLCADILTGKIPLKENMAQEHGIKEMRGEKPDPEKHDYYPFMFYEIRSEDQPSHDPPHGVVYRKVLFGLLGSRYATCREVGDSTRFPLKR